MAHTALARRYRPRRFADVATQEHVSETLRRAVSGGRVGHAYLFCGPRGVGKTTLARVLAMALNCQDRSPEGEPCGECESCSRIWAGSTALDVVEIDAASNRGVDDARDLRSRAMYAPSEEGRFKVYIVDEAHMLTREAWNALLKVLEEPPDRVIFIFATTEPEKIEQTAAPILSRCQRFDFRRVGVPEIVERLSEVLTREGTEAPDDALRLIARKADGGMRDALSLTDQVLALSDGSAVDVETVRKILGVVEEERFLQLMDLLAAQDQAGIFQLIEDLLDQGYDLVEFYGGVVEVLRFLLRIRVGGQVPELAEESLPEWEERARRFASGDLVRMLGMAAELEAGGSLRRSSQPRVLLELLLLRFSYLDRTVELEELLRAVGGEESGGPDVRPSAGRPNGPPSAPPSRPSTDASPRDRPSPPSVSGSGPPPDSRARTSDGNGPAGARSAEADDSPAAVAEVPDAADGEGAAEGSQPAAPEDLRAGWRDLLASGEGIPPGLSPFLMGAEVGVTGEGVLEVALPPGPALERLSTPEELGALRGALARHVEGEARLVVVEAPVPEASEESRVSQGEVREGRLGDLLEEEPGLRGAVEGWDLEIVD